MRLYKKLRWMIWNNIPQINADPTHTIRKGGLTKTVGEWNLSEHERLLRINDNKVDHPRDGSKDLADVDAILSNDLADLEVTATFGATGLQNMPDTKRLLLVERFITERDNVKKSGVPREKILAKMAEVMQMTYADTVTLNEYADNIYPQFRI
jgi:hypothetical protein